MDKKSLRIITGLFVLLLFVVGTIVTSVQGQVDSSVGVVNMEAVFTEHMAPPLFEARDQMQREFDERSDDLTEEEEADLFREYQARLEALEARFVHEIEEAIAKVAANNGFDVVVDSAIVLYGGRDQTMAVLEVLAEQE